MSTKSRNYTLILILSICILVVLGRYALKRPATIPESSLSIAKKTIVEQRAQEVASSSPQETQDQNKLDECVKSLQDQVKRDSISYDKESILVGFKSTIDFAQAKVILSGYKLGIESEAESKESYSANKILTATVQSGSIFEKICIVKTNAGVRYAGLNTLFPLHQ